MARNRALGSPYQTEIVSGDFTTDHGVDAYMIDTVPLTVTLDPYAVNHDRVTLQDLTQQAAAHPISIYASEGQTINGFGSSMQLAIDGGTVQLTYRGGVWIPSLFGAQGAGTTGATGATGAAGTTGATGATGTTGATGATGA